MESDGPAVAVAGAAAVVAAPEGAPLGVAAGVWAGVLRAGTNTSDDAASDSQRDGKRLFFLMFSRKTSTFQAMVGRCTFPTARGPEVCQSAVADAGSCLQARQLMGTAYLFIQTIVRVNWCAGSKTEVIWRFSGQIGSIVSAKQERKRLGYHQVVIGAAAVREIRRFIDRKL